MDDVEVAVAVAHRLGLAAEKPIPLRSTNNVVVWLRPSHVVAKISRVEAMAARELAIGHELADRGAPIVIPAAVVGAKVHEVDGRFVTLWRHVPVHRGVPLTSDQIAVALHTLHEALAPLALVMPLPSYESQLGDAIRALDEPSFAPALEGRDRLLLRAAIAESLADLQQSAAIRVIHGSPHDMNIVVDAGRPLFIDLETVERGPVEWDLAHLAPEVAVRYPAPYDEQTLATSRVAVSATTSTWCWNALHRSPDMRWHAEHHLAEVKRARR